MKPLFTSEPQRGRVDTLKRRVGYGTFSPENFSWVHCIHPGSMRLTLYQPV